MNIWYKELGFYNNPFSIKPAAFHSHLFGAKEVMDNVLNHIRERKVIFVEGKYGTGKTTLLKKIIREFKGKNRLVYYSCNRTERNIDVDDLLIGGRGLLGRLLKMKARDMILLLDEAQDLTEYDSKNLYDAYSAGFFCSIVMVSDDRDKMQLDPRIRDLVKDNIFGLGDIGEEEAINIVKARVGGVNILPDNMIKELWKKAKKNPRRLLMNCEETCRYAVDNGYETVSEEVIDKAFA